MMWGDQSSRRRGGRSPGLLAAMPLLLIVHACFEPVASQNQAAPATIATAAAPANASASVQRRLVLDGKGLTAIAPDGRQTSIPFGVDRASAIRMMADVLGPPDSVGTNQECPIGAMQFASWSKGLSVNFQEGKFVGWDGAVDLKTARGIGFGSSRAALDKAYDPTIEETSLGTEFDADGVTGVLESAAPDAAVSALWAGMTCVAR